jgi:hypothetical protein
MRVVGVLRFARKMHCGLNPKANYSMLLTQNYYIVSLKRESTGV